MMVRAAGLEPARNTPRDFKSRAATISPRPRRLPFVDNLNSFVPIMLPPVEAFIHHRIPTMAFVFDLTKNPVGFSIADGESVVEHLRFLSDYRFILHQKRNNVH